MSPDAIDELLSEWERRREAGTPASPADLCPDDPARRAELERRVAALAALGRFDSAGGGAAPDPPGAFTFQTSCPVQRFLARGGMGEVFLANDPLLGRPVAVKRSARFGDERFLKEAAITSRLDHPGVVPVYALGTDAAGRRCYAMRFVDGVTLRAAIDAHHSGGGEGLRALLGRFTAVCNTVAYAHSRGILHRDLKPANVLLGPFGETLVVDWGLARFVDQRGDAPSDRPPTAESLTDTGTFVGTAAYAAPEQLEGREVGPPADVFALGAVLHDLLTGRPPITDASLQKRLARLTAGEFDAAGSPPPALLAVARHAMRYDPAARYGSALAIAADVQAWLADEPVCAYRGTWGERAGRWARRHRALVRGVAAVLAATLVAAAVALVLVYRARQQSETARADAERSRDEAAAALDDLSDEVVERQLGQRSQLGPAERQFLERIAGRTERLLASAADGPRRAAGLLRLAVVRSRLDDGPAVAELFDRAVAAAREAGDPTLAARALVKQAGHLAAVGKSDAARAALAEAVPHLAGRSAAAPEDLGLRFELAAARIQAANLTMWTESAAAEAVFDAEAAVLRDLAARHPAAQPYRETLARVLTNSANLNASQGKLDPAADRVAEAVELFRTLAADDPRQPAHRAALAAALVTKGMLAEDRNQPDAAAAAHDAAAGELRRLAAESPAVYRHRTALGFALLTAGNLHRRAGRTADALARYDDALAEYRSLVREQSAVPTHHWHLSEAALEAAWLRPAARAALIEEATRHADRAVELAPADRAYQRHRDRVRAATTTPN